ncbi:CD276 antigen-like isoform X2 [Epinephelus fuscoguttatus]|uniref:CD276 antigen-like isoform X2 n=1 Tax=Epinephelus fuscoguttatus TaxID=293821 RepID=UPI0020D0AE3E|nr:CD276 antigen-like isoform X2 [Epinephelus fuscoguttatus]
MKLQLDLLCFCLLCFTGKTLCDEKGPAAIKVLVSEGSDVTLPCSLSTKENIEQKLFVWRKHDGMMGVFMYDKGLHHNNGGSGQDEQFKGRVFHFQDELKHGNASIIIRNTKMADSGDYTCVFPFVQRREKSHVMLVVVSSPKPSVTVLDATDDGVQLQCEVHGASPKPEVEWKDSDGNILPAEETQVTDRGGSYDIILQTTVTKTDCYHCVVTQEEINHQIHTEIPVYIIGNSWRNIVTCLVVAATLAFFGLVVVWLFRWYHRPNKRIDRDANDISY